MLSYGLYDIYVDVVVIVYFIEIDYLEPHTWYFACLTHRVTFHQQNTFHAIFW